MARKRYQQGQLWLEGKSWYGRWREDEEQLDGVVRRVRRKEKIGSKADYPTRPLAQRAFADRLAHVNRIGYRPVRVARFSDFARSWETNVLSQYGASTAINYRTHVRKHIVPFFGAYAMREISTELVQQFVSSLKVSRKTARNILITLKAMWNKAKEWGYASDGVTEGVVLPKSKRRQRFFASQEQIQRIVTAAEEPYRTFYGLAAETGLRPGELCGLTVDDLDLQRGMLQVRQSAWRGKLGDPKTLDSIRVVELSSHACAHLQRFLIRWQPNDRRLLFATRNGTPWDQNLLLKRKFKPLLAAIGIKVPRGDGFYIFRHGNATLMSSFGAPQKLRQERLGHADGSPVTETIYTHVISEDGKRIAARLGEAVWGILDPNGPKNGNGPGVEPPKPFVVN